MNDATRLIGQELQSSRYLASQAADGSQEGCICCGVDYAGNGPFCLRCLAPVGLSRAVQRRGTPPNFIPVLGASGAGKTVYLGMLLDMLSKGVCQLAGLATGSVSVGVQVQTTTALEHGRFPEKTPVEAEGWQWVHCEVSARGKSAICADIITPDLAGESIAQEMERPGTFPAIRHVLEQASGLLVLCDSLRVRDAALGEDLFAMKLASYLAQLHESRSRRRSEKIAIPLALVLTKADQCHEAADDPRSFACSNLPRLLQFFERRFSRHQFFASSVVGSSAAIVDAYGCRQQAPFHVEPRGIIEPLAWVLGVAA